MKFPVKMNPAFFGALILAAFIAGFGIRGGNNAKYDNHAAETEVQQAEEWTCSMHPQIRQPKPGQCPICGMDLIPVISDNSSGMLSPGEITLSPQAAKLAEVQVATVRRGSVDKEIRLVGKIDYDETLVKKITAWIPGRIDNLHVDFTGTEVRAGQALASVYSPELITTQQELIQAKIAAKDLEGSTLETLRESSARTLVSAREKLRLLGLSQNQIASIEESGKTSDHLTITSPLSGVVIEKNVAQGMYVETGMMLYSIADLSSVWAKLDVYESDLQWIKLGQQVEFTSEAYPGENFLGKVAFIDPILNSMTRTVKVRVNVPNSAMKLKPDMFVRSVISARMGRTGGGLPLVIPASAPLLTGKRAVVYVESPGKEYTYEGREIVLGPRAGDYYEVKDGLAEGERVVVNGAFKIDSAVQILAKPSMMSPKGGIAPPVHDHGQPAPEPVSPHSGHTELQTPVETVFAADRTPGFTSKDVSKEFKAQLDCIYSGYFKIQDSLSRDNFNEAGKAARDLAREIETADKSLLKDPAKKAWASRMHEISSQAAAIVNAKDIEKARSAFLSLSISVVDVAEQYGISGNVPVYRFHCPMADNNRGADWLQGSKDIKNPYFGASMLQCGELTGTISAGN